MCEMNEIYMLKCSHVCKVHQKKFYVGYQTFFCVKEEREKADIKVVKKWTNFGTELKF